MVEIRYKSSMSYPTSEALAERTIGYPAQKVSGKATRIPGSPPFIRFFQKRCGDDNISNQRGNVLWFILLAVALLGLLTYVLSRSSSSVNQTGDVEQQRIKASQILRHIKGIESSVQRLMLGGCGENEINFDNNLIAGYDNTRAPDDGSCDVFGAAGAGVEAQDMREQSRPGTDPFYVTGHTAVSGVEDDGRAELLFMIPVSKTLCTTMNKDLDISTDDADITNDENILSGAKFAGTYTLGTDLIDSTALQGRTSGCTLFNGAQDYGMVYGTLTGR